MKKQGCIVLLGAALALGGCGMDLGADAPEPEAPRDSVFGPGGLSAAFGDSNRRKNATETLGVNSYLWRASLETLSFLPLASADPLGGAITTDWGAAPGASGERFKVTAYITDEELRSDALRVVVNRQVGGPGGWRDAPASPETARRLEDAILTRARQIRVDSLS